MKKVNLEGTNYEIYLISQQHELKELLERVSKVTLVIQMEEIKSKVGCKAIVVDGELIALQDLLDIKKMYPEQEIIYKLVPTSNLQQKKNIQTTCAAHNIHVLSPNLTVEEIKEEVEKILFQVENANKKRVVSFFGTHSGAGLSTTVLNVADILGKKIDEKVIVLSLNPWDPSDYFLPYEGKYLSDIKIELKTETLSAQKLLQSVQEYESFSHLAGNRDIKLQRYYKTDEISELINLAKQSFDLVLIDSGTHFDNAAYAQSYKEADLKFLVTTQDPKGFRGYWPHIFHQLIEPIGGKTDDFLMILNQYSPDLSLISEKSLSEEMDMTLLATIPDQSLYGPTAIVQKKLLHQVTTNRDYRESLEMIANSIIARSQLNVHDINPQENHKGFIGKLFLKKKQVI